MNIQQASSYLDKRKQPFDITIEKDGETEKVHSLLDPFDINVSETLQETVDAFDPDAMVITTRRRNGNSTVKENEIRVEIGSSGLGGPVEPVPLKSSGSLQDYREFVIRDQEKQIGKLERKLEKAEEKVEHLEKENSRLDLENKTKDREFELKMKESDISSKNSLSGIMENVSSNPQLAQVIGMFASRIMGVEAPPATQPSLPSADQEEIEGSEIKKQVIKQTMAWMKTLPDETLAKHWALTRYLAQDVSVIDGLLQEFNSQTPVQNEQ